MSSCALCYFPATLSCDGGVCNCEPNFVGPRCLEHIYMLEPTNFYALFGTSTALRVLVSVFAMYLLAVYFTVVRKKVSEPLPQQVVGKDPFWWYDDDDG